MELRLVFRGLLLAGSLVLGYFLYKQLVLDRREEEQVLTRIPVFEFPLIGKSGVVTRHQFRNQVLVVSYFNPDCSHCRKLAATVGAKPRGMTYKVRGRKVSLGWLWVTRFDEDKAWAFMQEFGLADRPGVWLAADREGAFYRAFGDMHVPSLYVFDSKGRLLEAVYDQPLYSDVLKILGGGRADKAKKTR